MVDRSKDKLRETVEKLKEVLSEKKSKETSLPQGTQPSGERSPERGKPGLTHSK